MFECNCCHDFEINRFVFLERIKKLFHIWYNRCFKREVQSPPVLILSCIQFLSYVFVVHMFFLRCRFILFSVVPFYFWASIRSFLRCRYTYFFRLSHFTFRLPYVLFWGVVIHTFFGCPILLLGFHTFFFAVSLYILFSVVPFYF